MDPTAEPRRATRPRSPPPAKAHGGTQSRLHLQATPPAPLTGANSPPYTGICTTVSRGKKIIQMACYIIPKFDIRAALSLQMQQGKAMAASEEEGPELPPTCSPARPGSPEPSSILTQNTECNSLSSRALLCFRSMRREKKAVGKLRS